MTKLETIVVGIDFSDLSVHALAAAAHLCDRTNVKRLHLVHVLQPAPAWPAPFGAYSSEALYEAYASAKQVVSERLAHVEVAATVPRITRDTRVGSPAQELAQGAVEVGADLLVVSSHARKGLRRVVLGSVASSLIRSSHCPVLVVGEDRPGTAPFKKIVAGVDLSDVSVEVLSFAGLLGALEGGEVVASSVYEIPPILSEDVLPRYYTPEERAEFPVMHQKEVEKLIAKTQRADVGVRVEVSTQIPPSRTILGLAEAESADLIVVGSSGHNAWQRFFVGSTATAVVSDATCPVLVVPRNRTEAVKAEPHPGLVPAIEAPGV